MEEKTIVKVLKELLSKTREKKRETKDRNLEGTNYDSALWAIVTALRGPDSKDDEAELKKLTTARIRGILGLESGSVTVRYDPLNDVEILRRNTLLDQRRENGIFGDHFRTHFYHAMQELKTLGYDVPEEELSF